MIYAFEEYQRNDKYDIDEEKRERIRYSSITIEIYGYKQNNQLCK